MNISGTHANAAPSITHASSVHIPSGTIIGCGETSVVSPITHSTLKIFEPRTFPIAMSGSLRIAATTESESSGILVPSATSESPITASGTLSICASEVAPATSLSAPKTRSPIPRITKITLSTIGVLTPASTSSSSAPAARSSSLACSGSRLPFLYVRTMKTTSPTTSSAPPHLGI